MKWNFSNKAHSCVEKNANISLVKIRLLDTDPESHSLRGQTLEEQIEIDVQEGLVPFFVNWPFFMLMLLSNNQSPPKGLCYVRNYWLLFVR